MAAFRYSILMISLLACSVAAGAQRSVVIVTEPNAFIWLNGVAYGKTDTDGKLEIKNFPAGAQKIRIRADGFKEITKPLVLGNNSIKLVKTTDEVELAFQEAERLSMLDRTKAAEAYRKVNKLKPTHVDAAIGLARILSDAGDFEGANAAIRSAVKIAPRNAEAAVVDGRIQKLSGDEEKAIASFKRAIMLGGGFQPEAYTGLAILFQERAEAAGAEGDIAAEERNYAESAKNFAVAVKQLGSGTDAPTIYQLLGLVYEKQKKYKEAIALYESFLRLFPSNPESTAVESFIVQLKKQLAEQD